MHQPQPSLIISTTAGCVIGPSLSPLRSPRGSTFIGRSISVPYLGGCSVHLFYLGHEIQVNPLEAFELSHDINPWCTVFGALEKEACPEPVCSIDRRILRAAVANTDQDSRLTYYSCC